MVVDLRGRPRCLLVDDRQSARVGRVRPGPPRRCGRDIGAIGCADRAVAASLAWTCPPLVPGVDGDDTRTLPRALREVRFSRRGCRPGVSKEIPGREPGRCEPPRDQADLGPAVCREGDGQQLLAVDLVAGREYLGLTDRPLCQIQLRHVHCRGCNACASARVVASSVVRGVSAGLSGAVPCAIAALSRWSIGYCVRALALRRRWDCSAWISYARSRVRAGRKSFLCPVRRPSQMSSGRMSPSVLHHGTYLEVATPFDGSAPAGRRRHTPKGIGWLRGRNREAAPVTTSRRQPHWLQSSRPRSLGRCRLFARAARAVRSRRVAALAAAASAAWCARESRTGVRGVGVAAAARGSSRARSGRANTVGSGPFFRAMVTGLCSWLSRISTGSNSPHVATRFLHAVVHRRRNSESSTGCPPLCTRLMLMAAVSVPRKMAFVV